MCFCLLPLPPKIRAANDSHRTISDSISVMPNEIFFTVSHGDRTDQISKNIILKLRIYRVLRAVIPLKLKIITYDRQYFLFV